MRIFLRTNEAVSHFQRILHRLIEVPGQGELILCSGYFCESPSSSILDAGLLPVILRGCSRIECVGAMPAESRRYRAFVDKIRTTGITIVEHPATRWHAKIAIKSFENRPVAALIGSSNLSRPAYCEPFQAFNYEADVFIWVPEYNRYFPRDYDPRDELSPVEAILSENQPHEEARLTKLRELIMSNFQ